MHILRVKHFLPALIWHTPSCSFHLVSFVWLLNPFTPKTVAQFSLIFIYFWFLWKTMFQIFWSTLMDINVYVPWQALKSMLLGERILGVRNNGMPFLNKQRRKRGKKHIWPTLVFELPSYSLPKILKKIEIYSSKGILNQYDGVNCIWEKMQKGNRLLVINLTTEYWKWGWNSSSNWLHLA